MLRILAFSFFPAFTPPRSGGELRLFNVYRELARKHEVVLITSSHLGGKETRIQHADRFTERRIPKDGAFVDAWNELKKVAGDGDLSAPSLAKAGKTAGAIHLAYLEEYPRADVIIHDFPFTVPYDIFIGFDTKPRVYNSHNCETDLYQKLHPEPRSQPIHQLVEELERKLVSCSDLIVHCGPDDILTFQKFANDVRLNALFVPNATTFQSGSRRSVRNGPIKSAVFIGSGHLPNVEAARLIVDKLAPASPEVTFHIIGGCLPEGQWPANVVRHGIIENEAKDALMARCDVALNPMMGGSGSNLKVFDFFRYGLPVISTPFGMRGVEAIDGVHFIGADIDRFAEVLAKPPVGRAKLEAIGAAGRKLAVEKYSWRTIVGTLEARLRNMKSTRDGPIGQPIVLALNDYDSFESFGGGATRTRALYDAVSSWSPTVFLCFSDKPTLEMRTQSDGLFVVRVPKTAESQARAASYNSRFHVSTDDIVAFRDAPRNAFMSAVYDVLRLSARIVISEHCYMLSLPYSRGDRFVYSSQNCELDLKRDLLQWHPDRDDLIRDLSEAERIGVEASALVVAVSEEDALALVRGRSQAAPVIVVRNGAQPPREASAEDIRLASARVPANSAVFLGSAHMPNVDAANHIVREIAPRCPEVSFHIVGSVCEALPSTLPPNVVPWGMVAEGLKTAVLQAATIALNPMLSGSGSNVKLADYLGNGLPVVTTKFGIRGYPAEISPHVWVAEADEFPAMIHKALADKQRQLPAERAKRLDVFDQHCTMRKLGEQFVKGLADIETPFKRVLFVTYRYVFPALGGGESMLGSLIAGLCRNGSFQVDVASADVVHIDNHERYGSTYLPVQENCAFVDVPNLRYVRFPVDSTVTPDIEEEIRDAWNAQPAFELAVYNDIRSTLTQDGLAWGWGYPEFGGHERRAMRSCGLHLANAGSVTLIGEVLRQTTLRIELADGTIAFDGVVNGALSLRFDAPAGPVALDFTFESAPGSIRPVAAIVRSVRIANQALDLAGSTILGVAHLQAERAFEVLARAGEHHRQGLSLTRMRGPHAPELEAFLESEIANYDLVVTHNNVFRPAVAAIKLANRHGVKSLLIPHVHLDDDFYHFPDMIESCRTATAVLAAPKAACHFLSRNGVAEVGYLPAGIDVTETFSDDDVAAFRALYSDPTPFVLVLGRKAGAKNYKSIIDAVGAERHSGLRVVLIGPDDDGEPIALPYAAYLGPQPRDVVRGALKSCFVLVNMSASESFGIVLLEAWLAGKPVIANAECAAFHDLAKHDHNALLVAPRDLGPTLRKLVSEAGLALRLALNGAVTARAYDWKALVSAFNEVCIRMVQTPLGASLDLKTDLWWSDLNDRT